MFFYTRCFRFSKSRSSCRFTRRNKLVLKLKQMLCSRFVLTWSFCLCISTFLIDQSICETALEQPCTLKHCVIFTEMYIMLLRFCFSLLFSVAQWSEHNHLITQGAAGQFGSEHWTSQRDVVIKAAGVHWTASGNFTTIMQTHFINITCHYNSDSTELASFQESFRKFQHFTDMCSKYNSKSLDKALRVQCTLTQHNLASLPKPTMDAYRAICQLQLQTVQSLGNITVSKRVLI